MINKETLESPDLSHDDLYLVFCIYREKLWHYWEEWMRTGLRDEREIARAFSRWPTWRWLTSRPHHWSPPPPPSSPPLWQVEVYIRTPVFCSPLFLFLPSYFLILYQCYIILSSFRVVSFAVNHYWVYTVIFELTMFSSLIDISVW